jgi:hypothetical protein
MWDSGLGGVDVGSRYGHLLSVRKCAAEGG